MPPRKERPSALSDSIFKAKLEQVAESIAGHVAEEIPVHNTFIQFAAPPGAEPEKKPLSTAPAWIGPSLQSMLQQVEERPSETDCLEEEASISPENLLLGSPKKIPVMKYSLSSSSARAAGLPEWSPTKVATVGATQTFVGWQEQELGRDDGVGDEVDSTNGTRAPSDLRTSGTPSSPSGPLPSMGSAQHAEGACKRCCFFPKGRCQNGYNCEFCHFEHEKRKRKKKKKSGAARRDSGGSESEDDSDAELPGLTPQNSGTGPSGSVESRASKQDPPTGPPFETPLPPTAPPLLPPRGLPLPAEPPPPAPNPVLAGGSIAPPLPLSADQYYGGGYDSMPPGVARAAPPHTGYAGAYGHPIDARLSPYYSGYDPAAAVAQATGRYLPPPR